MSRSIQKLLFRIDELLQGGAVRTAADLAEALGVSSRTVNRYVTRLREEFGAPVEGSRDGYRYAAPFSLRPVRYSEKDLFALYAAQSILRPLRGTFLTEQIRERIREILRSMGDRVTREEVDLRNYLSFHQSGTPAEDLDGLFDLLECALSRTRLRIRYRSLGSERATERRVDPYALSNRNGVWYLIAHDHRRGKRIHFNVARIEGFRRAGTFERDPRFDLEAHFRGSFSVMKGERPETVRIVLRREAARFVREREFHPSQVLRDLPDGSVEFEVTVDEPEELIHFVRGFGPAAEVLEPGWFRERMAIDADELGRIYRRPRPAGPPGAHRNHKD
jgi:predicted DNA-binding transcriptional regulator YafY